MIEFIAYFIDITGDVDFVIGTERIIYKVVQT